MPKYSSLKTTPLPRPGGVPLKSATSNKNNKTNRNTFIAQEPSKKKNTKTFHSSRVKR